MKNNIKLFTLFTLFSSSILFSCSKDDSIQFNEVGIEMNAPKGITNYTFENTVITFTEINTGIETSMTINSTDQIKNISNTLPTGSYNINLNGTIVHTDADGNSITSKVKAYKSGVLINSSNFKLVLDLFISNETSNLILKEIYFTGSVTPEGKQYNGDKYFIIYNNSEETLYADGLLISEAAFLSTTKREYTPDVMNEAFTAGNIVMIPGSGKEYPILPGKQIIVANNAINHLEYNPNSLDLRAADFEIDLISTINVDNPEVKNTVSVVGTLTMHNRGFKSYVIAKLPQGVSVDQYKTANYYSYSFLNAAGNVSNSNAYKIPNEYILDAVNLSVEESFEWILTSPQLDLGWTYCGKTSSDNSRYGKTVLRKVLTTNPDGTVVYQDTNDSTVDFIAESKPSLKK